jgi:TolB-like protein
MLSYQFGDLVLDNDRRELRRGAELVNVAPQVFDVLVHLLANRHRVVSKDELLAAVWKGRIVSESTLSSRINAARTAVGDSGADQRLIKTLARKGFRFVGEVQEVRSASVATQDASKGHVRVIGEGRFSEAPQMPSIVVLPLVNLSADPEQDYFADGMTAEIITALSRIRWLSVSASGPGFTHKDTVVSAAQAGRELEARYVLEGSVRKGRGRIRIIAQLIDAPGGTHLWSERFDGGLEDAFDLQQRVALSVAGVIEPAVEAAEMRRSARSRINDPTTYDLYLRALADHLSFEKARVLQALELLEQALAREPYYAQALSVAAWCHVQIDTFGWTNDDATNRREGLVLAHRALQVADDDPTVIGRAAFVVGRFGDDINGAIALIDRSLQLNPGFAGGWHISGWLRLFAGYPDLAIEHFGNSTRLAPRGQRMETLTGIGMGHLLSRRFDEAISVLRVSLEQFPHFAQTYRYLAAAYVHAGRVDEARRIVTRLQQVSRIIVPAALPFRNQDHRELVLSGLRRALGVEPLT